ncbi:MAG: hypothetical protein PPHEESC_5990 [uncultured Paraburkholderia sp.]|nr:MAG: hypothetical protein PPHEESC_5990 [uncultured Paraburkholderia sp.]CAH2943654.1 MAG: hypothetical protein PPHEMADMSA_6022 [uncultured Paraburkholderia sp.]CAH2944441.1 MAG: hypothetical protein PPHERAN_6037 [uncultured Paraburkholderia sp.]
MAAEGVDDDIIQFCRQACKRRPRNFRTLPEGPCAKIKSRFRAALNELRTRFYERIERHELDLTTAVIEMRRISGLTQADFAAHRGVSLRVIQDIECGVGNPTVESLNRIAAIFGLEVAFVRKKRS